MHRFIFTFLVTGIFTLCLSSTSLQASYYAHCIIDARLVEIKPRKTNKSLGSSFHQLHFKVLSYSKGGGHSKRHCARFVGRKYTRSVYTGHDKTLLKKLRPGARIRMKYNFYEGLTPKGVVSNEYFNLKEIIVKTKRRLWVARSFSGGRQCQSVDYYTRAMKRIKADLHRRGLRPLKERIRHLAVCAACSCPDYNFMFFIQIKVKQLKLARKMGYRIQNP